MEIDLSQKSINRWVGQERKTRGKIKKRKNKQNTLMTEMTVGKREGTGKRINGGKRRKERVERE